MLAANMVQVLKEVDLRKGDHSFSPYAFVPLHRVWFLRFWDLKRVYNFTIDCLEQGVIFKWKPWKETPFDWVRPPGCSVRLSVFHQSTWMYEALLENTNDFFKVCIWDIIMEALTCSWACCSRSSATISCSPGSCRIGNCSCTAEADSVWETSSDKCCLHRRHIAAIKNTPRVSDYGSTDGSKGTKNLGANRLDLALSF